MSDIRFNQWLHQSGTGGVSQVDGGHVGIGTTNPDIAVHTANTKKINVGIVTANSVFAGNFYGDGSNLTGITGTTINNNADNRVITGSGTANTLEGEANVVINGGKLGIGVASPNQLIEVHGASNPAVLVQDTTNNCISYMYSQDSVATFGSASNHPVVFNVNNSERLRIDSTGRVLVNTTTTNNGNNKMIIAGPSPSGTYAAYDGQLALQSSETSGAINTGSALVFFGHDGGNQRGSGAIRCLKENGTSGNHNFYMSFLTRVNGGSNTEKLRITSSGHVEPANDNTYNFGSLTKRWANLYTADLNLSNEGKVNDVDGTWGQYTIQEGEDNLYLINKRSGKKYKFLLQEVS